MKKQKSTNKSFNPKDAVIVFSSLSYICIAIIFALMVYDVLTIQDIFSFEKPIKIVISIIIYSIGLVLFGIILTMCIPSKYIDDTNKSYQKFSVSTILVFMFLGALFEELLFRGIIQNLIFEFIENQWMTIIITTLVFVGMHTQYFKKPIMFINITIPSVVFCWIYFQTSNLLVPFFAHFLMNVSITLLFKYNFISVKK